MSYLSLIHQLSVMDSPDFISPIHPPTHTVVTVQEKEKTATRRRKVGDREVEEAKAGERSSESDRLFTQS